MKIAYRWGFVFVNLILCHFPGLAQKLLGELLERDRPGDLNYLTGLNVNLGLNVKARFSDLKWHWLGIMTGKIDQKRSI